MQKRVRNGRNKIYANRSLDPAERVHAIARFTQTCARCGGLHGRSWRRAGSRSRAHRETMPAPCARPIASPVCCMISITKNIPARKSIPSSETKFLPSKDGRRKIREAIMGHAQYSGVPRKTHLAKALFACDELAGFLTAVSLVKPTRSIFDVDVPSVRKKMKDKAFARGVHREDIVQGAQELRPGSGCPHRLLHCRHASPRGRVGPRWRSRFLSSSVKLCSPEPTSKTATIFLRSMRQSHLTSMGTIVVTLSTERTLSRRRGRRFVLTAEAAKLRAVLPVRENCSSTNDVPTTRVRGGILTFSEAQIFLVDGSSQNCGSMKDRLPPSCYWRV